MRNVMRDVRFGLRLLAKNPGFTAIALTLIATSLVACYVPARWAATVDPASALRER